MTTRTAELEALSEHLLSVYDHGTSPNALGEAASILVFLADRGYRQDPEPEWEYGASVHLVEDGADIEMQTLPWGDRDQAVQVVADGNADQRPGEPLIIRYVLVKRTASVRAGEWVTADDEMPARLSIGDRVSWNGPINTDVVYGHVQDLRPGEALVKWGDGSGPTWAPADALRILESGADR